MITITEKNFLRRCRTERGAVAAEYSLLLALIAVAIVGAVTGLLGAITTPMVQIVTALN